MNISKNELSSIIRTAIRDSRAPACTEELDVRGVCIVNPDNTSQCINIYQVVLIKPSETTVLRYELVDGTLVTDPVFTECTCDCVDLLSDECVGEAAIDYEAELTFVWTPGFTVYLNGELFHTLTGADFAAGGAALETAFIEALTDYYLTVPGTLTTPTPAVTVVNDGETDTGALFTFTGCSLVGDLTIQMLDDSLVEVDTEIFTIVVE